MIVITLTKVPKSLQGDLTKWYQEIQTGVYVGNVSARIRDLLWERIMKNIGRGEATMVYNTNNELGYSFRTTRQDRAVVDFEGIPLMMHLNVATGPVKHGFSDAAKFHRAKVMTRKAANRQQHHYYSGPLVTLDLETTGLDPITDEIISIGAMKQVGREPITQFYQLVNTDHAMPDQITALTKITADMLAEQGIALSTGLKELKDFIGDADIIGYNLRFDEAFLSNGLRKTAQPALSNKLVDLMPIVKKSNKFLDNYRLETVLADYEIENSEPHQALADAKATLLLANKLIENGVLKI